ncbi:AfsR/SARP family transcriptional regulator [Kitasatospora sp. GAS204B]|uniref:AfsR/SARP family transcriptional regulator n=1 Tax=unclassified Kitasatospora TaxID=2633591 RepID=UPI002475CE52|nr:AfsR/SARP family transcriptional regulator [Kitasatospora sp. GAS204B]MDH6119749.1 DNA-binding SARP family transcriptional activator [Kitasatospora sp. GAS204B]
MSESEENHSAPAMAVRPSHDAGTARFTVLGLLSITDAEGVAVLQPSKPAVLLAALLVRPNAVVSLERLQQVIWGQEHPASAKAALQSCVVRLRRLFGTYGISGTVIEAVPGGYRLLTDAQGLDLLRFREIRDRAAAADDVDTELELLHSALDLWQFPLLVNVGSAVLHRDEVPQLEDEWLQTAERVFDIELSLGHYREAVVELRPVARAYPMHERFWEQLIEALWGAGRRAEALCEYRRVKKHLLEELGVDPGLGLQRLEMAILRGESNTADRSPVFSPETYDDPPDGRYEAEAGQLPPGDRVSGELVLAALVRAGLLQEEQRGSYRMHALLRVFTCAAGERQQAACGQSPMERPVRSLRHTAAARQKTRV